jgi:hypothetical protein
LQVGFVKKVGGAMVKATVVAVVTPVVVLSTLVTLSILVTVMAILSRPQAILMP